MGSKTISLTEEAYERLREHKQEDESFTDVVLRLTDRGEDPLSGFGAMNDVDGFREAVAQTRDDLDEDLRDRADG
jgi:predicted CopG family antitoxin